MTKHPVLFLAFIAILSLLTGQYSTAANTETNNAAFLEQYKEAAPHFQAGIGLLGTSTAQAALAEFQEAVKKMPTHVFAHFYLSRIFYSQGQNEKALHHICEARKYFDSMLALKQFADKQNYRTLSKDERVLDKLLDRNHFRFDCTTTRELKYKRYKVVSEMQHMDNQRQARETEKTNALKARYAFFHGTILLKMENYSEAFKRFQETVKLNPSHWEGYNNMSALLYLGKAYTRALHYLEEAESNGGSPYINLKLKKDIYKALGKPTAGIMENEFPGGVMQFTIDVNHGKKGRGRFYENTYILFDKATKDAVLIDPGCQDKRIDDFITSRGLKIRKILNTHGHIDHTAANRYYANLYHTDVTGHQGDNHLYKLHPGTMPQNFLINEKPLSAGSLRLNVIHIPGHTPGSVCFLCGTHLFCGDTLAKESIGRINVKNPEEHQKLRERFVRQIKDKLLTLPGDTMVFPGHGPTTQISHEKKNNPHLIDIIKKPKNESPK